jgi:hypothetical protein
MPREGAIIFRDHVGKLDVLNIECENAADAGAIGLTDWSSTSSPTKRPSASRSW